MLFGVFSVPYCIIYYLVHVKAQGKKMASKKWSCSGSFYKEKEGEKRCCMCVMRQIMCLLNIEACKHVLEDTHIKSMNLKISITCPL